MHKADYKRTFLAVRPSEEAMERIFSMTEHKPRKIRYKGLIAVVAVLALLLCGTLTANAATDGKLFMGVQALASADEVKLAAKESDNDTLLQRIKITVNGEEVSLDDYIAAKDQLDGTLTVRVSGQPGLDGMIIERLVGDEGFQSVEYNITCISADGKGLITSAIFSGEDKTVRIDIEPEADSDNATN